MIPVVQGLADDGAVVSIDTMRAEVAREAIAAGAGMVNDVSGGLADPDMVPSVVTAGVPFIAMHWRGHSTQMQSRAVYDDVVADVCRELASRRDALLGAGLAEDLLVLDPGLGFAKHAAHNWALLAALPVLHDLGHPILLGASRKTFLGWLGRADGAPPRPAAERDPETAATSVMAAMAGLWCVRVHDVESTVRALSVVQAALEHAPDGGDGGDGLGTVRTVGTAETPTAAARATPAAARATSPPASTATATATSTASDERPHRPAGRLRPRQPRRARLREARRPDLRRRRHHDVRPGARRSHRRPRSDGQLRRGGRRCRRPHHRPVLRPHRAARGGDRGRRAAKRPRRRRRGRRAQARGAGRAAPSPTSRCVSRVATGPRSSSPSAATSATGARPSPRRSPTFVACPGSRSPASPRSSRPTRSEAPSSRPTSTPSRWVAPRSRPTPCSQSCTASRPRHGRTREIRWGARTLDLDLIQFGAPGSSREVVSDDERLTLPHPRAAERAFVLVPWLDADPRATLRVGPGPDGIRPVADLVEVTWPDLHAAGVRPGPGWEHK